MNLSTRLTKRDAVIIKLFHHSAHRSNPLFIFFEISYPLSKHLMIHIIRIRTEEIVHQTSKWTVASLLPIDIKDMRPVLEHICCIRKHTPYFIYRFSTPPYIMLGNKYNIGLRERTEQCPLSGLPCIKHTAVVSCAARNRPLITALYLHIIEGLSIGRESIKSHRTPVEIRHTMLSDNLCDA